MISGQLGLVLGISVVLLLVVGGMGAVLALGFSKLSPLPAKPPESSKEAEVEPVDEEALAARKAAYRRGVYVLLALAVLTAVEFLIATVLNGSVVLLFVIVLAKAGLILQYYMHAEQIWSEGEAHG